VREGLQIAIVGKPNVGKSSLFNALAGASRAIVTDVPGTTRDLVSEVVDLDGLRVTLVDTAGLRETRDAIEAEGVARSRQAQSVADLILIVVDRAAPLEAEDRAIIDAVAGRPRLIAANKSDIAAGAKSPWDVEALRHAGCPIVEISAVTGDGLEPLRDRIASALDATGGGTRADRPEITNVRHIALVQRADEALARARHAVLGEGGALPEEFVLADLQEARAAFEEITGRRVSEDLLAHIFSRFCIGK
jgi:tRNA modification GTPase